MLKFEKILNLYISVNNKHETLEIKKMILLFGETNKTANTSSAKKTGNSKNNPVENAGVLAMGFGKSYLSAGEYDSYSFSTSTVINYSDYSDSESFGDCGFMSDFSSAVATLGSDCGSFSDGGFSGCSSSGSSSCSSFSSFG